ncbi:putative polysaccharide biosynthesis protein [Caminicella sporogenes]|uniref:putative polysaccharide biosynthesis protein n=1 Tax=Caminicella sporogenes TaxID=166485 RepID=UPI00253FE7BD|nr:polysaccharide biosynthesis protein [Caminicella sporogenes]WIF94857.1 polysaccharide biosynthesis protein [Caminicella sporogenes]
MNRNSFIYSTIILVIANFCVRFLGFTYRIFLSRYLGSKGIGLYHLLFHTFLIFITITTSGIPIAVSKIVAQKKSLKDFKGCQDTLFISMSLGIFLSFLISILLIKNTNFIIKYLLQNNKLYESLLSLLPAIIIVTLSSILRSYYYGIKNVKPVAVSQILEQVIRIIFVIGILHFSKIINTKYSVTIATLGIFIGEFGGLLYLISKFERHENYEIYQKKYSKLQSISIFSNIVIISFPITIARFISVLMQSINMFIVPQRLQMAGYNLNQSVATFGEVVGMTLPLLFLPFIVTSAIVVNIIPNISEEKIHKKWNNINIKSILAARIAILIAVPIGFVFFFFSRPICTFLYDKPNIDIYLKYLSFTVVFLSLQHIISGILHGMGKQVITTITHLIGMSVHFTCIYFLIPDSKIGIIGFHIGFFFSTFITFILNLLFLKKYIPLKLSLFNHIIKPVLASCIMTISMKLCYIILLKKLIPIKITIVITTLIGSIIYLTLILITKCIKIKTINFVIFGK